VDSSTLFAYIIVASGVGTMLVLTVLGYIGIRIERYLRHRELQQRLLDKRTGIDRE